VNPSPIAYLIFTVTLGVILAGIIIYTYSRKRKDRMEKPKFRMLEDDEE